MTRIFSSTYRQSTHPGHPTAWGARCSACPLQGQTPVWGDGPPLPALALVGEAPGRDEVSLGIPFVGASGEILVRWLEKLGLSRQEVWVDNAVACFPEGGDLKAFLQRKRKELGGAFNSPIACCRPRLMRALKVPFCKGCAKFLRGPDETVCRCPTPRKGTWRDGTMADVTVPMGNFALQAVVGAEGIMAHQGYVFDLATRRNACVVAPVTERSG